MNVVDRMTRVLKLEVELGVAEARELLAREENGAGHFFLPGPRVRVIGLVAAPSYGALFTVTVATFDVRPRLSLTV